MSFNLAADGRDEEAARALSQQGAILLERRRADPSDRAVRRSLEQNLYLQGSALQKAGNLDEALQTFRRSGEVVDALRREEPASVTYQRDQGYLRTEIGNCLLKKGDARAALVEYRGALDLFRGLAAADPKSTDPVLGVGMSHHNAGEAFRTLGERREALRELRLAPPFYEAVLAASPSNAWVSGMLAAACTEIADLETEVGSRVSACALYRRSVAIVEKLAGSGPLTPERQASLAHAKIRAAECTASGFR